MEGLQIYLTPHITLRHITLSHIHLIPSFILKQFSSHLCPADVKESCFSVSVIKISSVSRGRKKCKEKDEGKIIALAREGAGW